MRGELREQQHPPAFLQHRRQHLHQPLELGRAGLACRAAFSLSSRGSQQAWRSLSSASRMMMPAARQAALGDRRLHLRVHGQPDRSRRWRAGPPPSRPARRSRSSAAAPAPLPPWSGAAGTAAPAAPARLRAAVAVLLDRRAIARAEAACAAEEARRQKVEQRPQLAEMVLQRRARQAQPLPRVSRNACCVVSAFGFLMVCASSSITTCQSCAVSTSWSRVSSG